LIEKVWVSLRDPKTLALILFITVMAIKLSIINYPSPEKPPSECVSNFDGCGFVFDEAHYIPAVRKLMMGEPANNEHPPLSKALMMLGIAIFGDNPSRVAILLSPLRLNKRCPPILAIL